MGTNKSIGEKETTPKTTTFWRDYWDDDKAIHLNSKIVAITSAWEKFGLEWMHAGGHQFKVGDLIILFCFDDNTIEVVKVVDIGPGEIKFPEGDLSHFFAFDYLEGFGTSDINASVLLNLKSKGLIENVTDFWKREELPPEKWEALVEALELREEKSAKMKK